MRSYRFLNFVKQNVAMNQLVSLSNTKHLLCHPWIPSCSKRCSHICAADEKANLSPRKIEKSKLLPLEQPLETCYTNFFFFLDYFSEYWISELNDKNSRNPNVLSFTVQSLINWRKKKILQRVFRDCCKMNVGLVTNNFVFRNIWIFTIFKNKNILSFPVATEYKHIFERM